MGLSPKPTKRREPEYTMADLDRYLQSRFSHPSLDIRSVNILVESYIPSKEEIISEGEKNGYKVTDIGNDRLRFE